MDKIDFFIKAAPPKMHEFNVNQVGTHGCYAFTVSDFAEQHNNIVAWLVDFHFETFSSLCLNKIPIGLFVLLTKWHGVLRTKFAFRLT